MGLECQPPISDNRARRQCGSRVAGAYIFENSDKTVDSDRSFRISPISGFLRFPGALRRTGGDATETTLRMLEKNLRTSQSTRNS